jgi:hypothetical protein
MIADSTLLDDHIKITDTGHKWLPKGEPISLLLAEMALQQLRSG